MLCHIFFLRLVICLVLFCSEHCSIHTLSMVKCLHKCDCAALWIMSCPDDILAVLWHYQRFHEFHKIYDSPTEKYLSWFLWCYDRTDSDWGLWRNREGVNIQSRLSFSPLFWEPDHWQFAFQTSDPAFYLVSNLTSDFRSLLFTLGSICPARQVSRGIWWWKCPKEA